MPPTASPRRCRPPVRRRSPPGPSTGSGSRRRPAGPPPSRPHPPDPGPARSWPRGAGTSTGRPTPNALHQPVQYTDLLRRAVATMLAPGNGVEGVIFTEFPQSGYEARGQPGRRRELQQGAPRRRRGLEPHRRRRWPRNSPAGSCTSRWPTPSCCTGSIRPGSPRRRTARAQQRMVTRAQARRRPPLPGRQRPLCRRPAGRHDVRVPPGAQRDGTGPRARGPPIPTSTIRRAPVPTTILRASRPEVSPTGTPTSRSNC